MESQITRNFYLDFTDGLLKLFVCFINIGGMKLRQPFKNPKLANKAPDFLKETTSGGEAPFSIFSPPVWRQGSADL